MNERNGVFIQDKRFSEIAYDLMQFTLQVVNQDDNKNTWQRI